MKTLKVFVSSPGDVGRERVLTGHVLDRLQGEFQRRALIEPYFWEHEPMRAVTDFQGNIPKPSEFDIVICILWSRLGAPLNDKYRHADGSPYASGTEYEFESSLEAHQLNDKPELLVYRNRQQPMIPIEPEAERNEKIRQFDALQAFLKRWFLNPDGTIRIASNDYQNLAIFEEKLENNLRDLIDQLAPPLAGPQPESMPGATYAKGSPFRQLRPFEFEDAEIFFWSHKGDRRGAHRNARPSCGRLGVHAALWRQRLGKIVAGSRGRAADAGASRRDRGDWALALGDHASERVGRRHFRWAGGGVDVADSTARAAADRPAPSHRRQPPI